MVLGADDGWRALHEGAGLYLDSSCANRMMGSMQHSLVLIPGLNMTAEAFDPVLAALPQTIQGQALDIPAKDSVEDIAKAALPGLPSQFWLAGFAFGAYVALAILEFAPKRVLGLALVCGNADQDSPLQAEARHRVIAHAGSGGHLEMVRQQATQALHPDSLQNAALMQRRMDLAAAYGSERFIAHHRACANRIERNFLLNGSVPTLFIAGVQDKAYPPEATKALAARVRGAEYAVILGSGHLVPLEQPVALARRLALWIQANAKAAVPRP